MADINTYPFTLPSGACIEFETLPEHKIGARDVTQKKQKQPIPFDTVMEPLGEVCQLILEKIQSTAKMPNIISVELGAALKGQTGVVIVSGEAQANIKVTLTWTKSD